MTALKVLAAVIIAIPAGAGAMTVLLMLAGRYPVLLPLVLPFIVVFGGLFKAGKQ